MVRDVIQKKQDIMKCYVFLQKIVRCGKSSYDEKGLDFSMKMKTKIEKFFLKYIDECSISENLNYRKELDELHSELIEIMDIRIIGVDKP